MAGLAVEWLFESPIVRVTRYRCLEDRAAPTEHRSPWPAIGFPRRGAFIVRFEGESETVVDASVALLLGPDEEYRSSHPFALGDAGTGLLPSEAVVRDLLREGGWPEAADAFPLRFPAHAHFVGPESYFRLELLSYRLRRLGGSGTLGVDEAAVRLAAEAIGNSSPGGASAEPLRRQHRDLAEAARRSIAARVPGGIGLADLAGELGVSPSHLCRVFRRVSGRSLHAHALRLRLRGALPHVMAGGEGSLSGIAHRFGFSSHSHFTVAFRREFGVTPSLARSLGRKPAAGPFPF